MNEEIISTYTLQQAIEDGIFVDVSEVARRNGFTIPVAITSNLFASYIQMKTEEQTAISLNAFLLVMYKELRNSKPDGNFFATQINFSKDIPITVWAVIEAQSPTDPNPAMSLMLPEDW